MDFLPPQPNYTGPSFLLFPSLPGPGSRPGLAEIGQELGGARENLYSARWCLGFQAELVILITFCL